MQFKYLYHLLCKYLFSPKITQTFGVIFANNVTQFLRKYVFTWERWFLFCYHKDIFHYEEYNNNPLEGTNMSLKHSERSTHPQLKLEYSFVVLNQLGEKKILQIKEDVVKCSQSTCQSNNNVLYDKLTLIGAKTLKTLQRLAQYSKCVRVKHNEWKVTRPKESFKNCDDMIIPKFKTVQTVTIIDTNRMKCSCSYSCV